MIRKMLQAILCITLCPLLAGQQAASPVSVPTGANKPIVLKKRTFMKLMLLEAVSSATATTGQSVRMAVKEDVTIDGVVVIPEGTPATGVVAAVRKAVPGKKNGSISIEPESVNPPNSKPIALRHYNYTLEDDAMCSGFLNCLPLVVAAPVYGIGDLIAYPFQKHHVTGEDEVFPACSEQWSVLSRSIVVQANGTTPVQPAHPDIDLGTVCPGGAKAFIS
jgi:hypothetical protein